MSKTYSIKKKEGATFTPNGLADFLSEAIVSYLGTEETIVVKDPSCGDGALLYSIAQTLKEHHIDYVLEGSDTNKEYLVKAQEKLLEIKDCPQVSLTEVDFVENRITSSHNLSYVDVFIANPPYVRTQVLGAEKAQKISQEYGLSGKVDLYYPFLINMTEQLKEGGILGVITSNKYLTTQSGKSIRSYLLSHYDVLEVIDLGDTKLFDAAVLPAIFIGRKNTINPTCSKSRFTKIYEGQACTNECISLNSVFDILKSKHSGKYCVGNLMYDFTNGCLQTPSENTDIWNITTIEDSEWIDRIKTHTSFYIGERYPVRVGVKSCADEVFFNQSWDSIPIPEDVFFRNIISQENIKRWESPESLTKVVYPHYDDNGEKAVFDIEKYQNAKKFFSFFEERLKKREYLLKSKTRKWYEYWVPQNPVLWKNPKIVFADISAEPRFTIDKTGAIVNGNCYWITSDNPDILYLIVGVASSNVLERYHDICFNNKLYNGKRRYLAQYVEQYPIPDIGSEYAQEIIKLTKKILSLKSKQRRKKLEDAVNLLVEKAFGLVD